MWCNDTSGASDGWDETQTDYFNIYNLGGYSTLETSGTAGRIDGGDVFELYAQNNSWAQANMTFRKLQHVHMLYHVWVANQRIWDDWETDTITIEMGLDYYSEPDSAWLEGWNVYLEQVEGWIGSGKMRLRWNVIWSYRGSQIKSNTMNSFPLVNESTDEGIPALTAFITDFWFNKVNASSTVGGRITSEYYAMQDSSNPWLRWATGSSWGVNIANVSQAMFFEDLVDSSGNIISAKQVEMMRIWVKLSQGANAHDVRVELRDYDLFDIVTAPNEMEGINTPIFIATKTPDMPQGGFLNALASSISDFFGGISDALGPAILGFWDVFVGFLDTVLSITGIPNLFTTILNIIGDFFGWVADSIAWVITSLTTMFAFLAVTLTKSLSVVVTTITSWVSMITNALSLISGGFGQTYNIFIDLRLDLWITIIGIFYAVWLFFLWDEKGLNAVLNHIEMIMNFFAFIIHTLISIVQFFWALITGIIEAIPIIE